ncbi:MAG: hypothetical protein K2M06_05250 [Muribaculaceae bacterium]|nr:hypothetical protein [Muribaculaceae bacterium]
MISSITTGPSSRASNFELLRILAMFFVLVVHADFAVLDPPTPDQLHAAPLNGATRILIEMFAIVSVNIFVLISGWFGIKASLRGFTKLLFQVVFYSMAVYLFFTAFGSAPFTGEQIMANLLKVWVIQEWFVMSYMVLYVLSPILNAYVENASGRQLGGTILAFYALQTLASLFYESEQFVNGYSAISFVGLYLLARWLRLYGASLLRVSTGLMCMLIPWLAASLAMFIIIWNAVPNIAWHFLFYSNPLIVIEAVGYLILFARIRPFVSRVVNLLSSGCFAVYLLHMNPWIYIHFKHFVAEQYTRLNGPVVILAIGAFLVAFFLVSCIIDLLIRQPFWRAISRCISVREKK